MSDSESESGCCICCEPFTSRRKLVKCISCEAETCSICVKKYLEANTQLPHCMSCKKTWTQKFLLDNLTKSWLHGAYRFSRQKLSLEREKSLMPQTMPIAEKIIAAEVEIVRLKAKKAEIEVEWRDVQAEIRRYENIAAGLDANAEKEKSYIFGCPKEDCKGFIESKSFKCGICKTQLCKSCHVVKPKKDKNDPTDKKAPHICKKKDVATAKLIMDDTKPCPTCKTRIFKILGCNQMFCTNCHTAFDWATGNVEKGVIHNPHFIEMQQKMGHVPRNALDQPCGGINDAFLARLPDAPYPGDNVPRRFIHDEDLHDRPIYNEFVSYVQRVGEINNKITQFREKDFLALRINYLRGNITDRKLLNDIFRIERSNEKIREERQILETFRVAMIERFNNLSAKTKLTKKDIDDTRDDIEKITTFCNDAFKENWKVMGYTRWPQIDMTHHYW